MRIIFLAIAVSLLFIGCISTYQKTPNRDVIPNPYSNLSTISVSSFSVSDAKFYKTEQTPNPDLRYGYIQYTASSNEINDDNRLYCAAIYYGPDKYSEVPKHYYELDTTAEHLILPGESQISQLYPVELTKSNGLGKLVVCCKYAYLPDQRGGMTCKSIDLVEP